MSAKPNSAAAAVKPRCRSERLSGGKCSPVFWAMNSLRRPQRTSGTPSVCMRAVLAHCLIQRARLFWRKKHVQVVDQYKAVLQRDHASDVAECRRDVRCVDHRCRWTFEHAV